MKPDIKILERIINLALREAEGLRHIESMKILFDLRIRLAREREREE